MNRNKIIIIQGIPGSGKSTYARLLYKAAKHQYIIVNRDDIRSMLGDYWVSSREKLVTEIEDSMIEIGLKNEYSIIIDATNLNPKTLKRFEVLAKKYGTDIIYQKMEITPKIAFLRILWRKLKGGRFIPYKVIKGFYDRYFNYDETKK